MPPNETDIADYAEALFALARAAGALTVVESQVATLLEALSGAGELQRFASDPRITPGGRARGVSELLRDQVHPVLLHVILLLTELERFHELAAIGREFLRHVSGLAESADGELVTAIPFSDEQLAMVESETGRILGKRVNLRPRIDPAIMGGAIVRVGDYVVDGSLNAQFEAIRQRMLTAQE